MELNNHENIPSSLSHRTRFARTMNNKIPASWSLESGSPASRPAAHETRVSSRPPDASSGSVSRHHGWRCVSSSTVQGCDAALGRHTPDLCCPASPALTGLANEHTLRCISRPGMPKTRIPPRVRVRRLASWWFSDEPPRLDVQSSSSQPAAV